jgi:hypothetical protein
MAEPDPDRGHVDGSPPDVVAFVVPGRDGAVLAEMAESPLGHVALLIGRSVESGGRPPALPRRSRFRTWSAGFGNGGPDPVARRWPRIAALEYALSQRTRPGRVRGRPGPGRAILSRPISGTKASESWR